MQKEEKKAIIAGLICSMIFGFSFLFTKRGLEVMDIYHLLALRFSFAFIVFLILRGTGFVKVNLREKSLLPLILISIIEPILYFIFETTGVKLTSSSETGMMIAVIPVVTLIFAFFILGERPGRKQIFFIFLSVFGMAFMILMKGKLEVGKNLLGTVFVLGAVVSAGLYNVISRKISKEYTPEEITYFMMIVGMFFFNAVSIIDHTKKGNISGYFLPLFNLKAVFSVVYLGFFSSVVAYFLLNYMLSRIETSRSSVFSNLTTLISIIAGVIWGDESFYWYNAVGSLLILIGVWGANRFSEKAQVDYASDLRPE